MQIVTLARILAIEADIAEMSTVERLREATSRGVLGSSSADRLADAFRVIWRIRLEHQIATEATGEEPSELVSLRAPQVRRDIDEAFDSIRAAQGALLQVPKLRIPGALVVDPVSDMVSEYPTARWRTVEPKTPSTELPPRPTGFQPGSLTVGRSIVEQRPRRVARREEANR